MRRQNHLSTLIKISFYLNNNYLLAILALLCGILIAIPSQLPPQLQRLAIDQYIKPLQNTHFSDLNSSERLKGLVFLSIIYIVIIITKAIAEYFFDFLSNQLAENILFAIRKNIFAKFQQIPLGFFDKNSVGTLMSRINYDVEGIKRFVSSDLLLFIRSILEATVILISIFILNWQIATLIVVASIVFIILSQFTYKRLNSAYQDISDKRAEIGALINESILGMRTIQLFNQENKVKIEFAKSNKAFTGYGVKLAYSYEINIAVLPMLANLIMVFTLWYGGGLAIQQLITLGTLVAFVGYTTSLFSLKDIWFQFADSLQSATANAKHIFAILDEPETILDPEEPVFIKQFRGKIEFKNVWFSYNTDDKINDEGWILRNISFTVNPGESVALVGATGAGKSTIISLISRFYDMKRGQILIDDVDIRQYKQLDLRKHISIVLQDVILFVDTIEANLRLSNKNVSLDEIIKICKLIGIHDFIDSLPDGYQTIVKERGTNFSTGQKQLFAFARALIHNPDGLLMLDEATANIDSHSELIIQQAINQLTKHRTSIIIAHRLSTIKHCDRIIVIKHGQIIEEGRHEELINQNGYYSTLYESQFQSTLSLEVT